MNNIEIEAMLGAMAIDFAHLPDAEWQKIKHYFNNLTQKHEEEKAVLEARIQIATENALTCAALASKKEEANNIINNVVRVLSPDNVDLSKTDVTE